MIWIILLLFLILWYYFHDIFNKPQIEELKQISNKIINHGSIYPKPSFNIYETNNYPHTINNNIYIVVKRKDGRKYDPETIILVLCHELAHILSGVGDEHGEYFQTWENNLLDIAEDLGFYYKGIKVADDYPCYK